LDFAKVILEITGLMKQIEEALHEEPDDPVKVLDQLSEPNNDQSVLVRIKAKKRK
jgi:hypothetical protein